MCQCIISQILLFCIIMLCSWVAPCKVKNASSYYAFCPVKVVIVFPPISVFFCQKPLCCSAADISQWGTASSFQNETWQSKRNDSLKSEFKWKVNCILSWKEKISSLSKLFEFYWKGVPKISWDKELLIACEWTSLMEILVKHMEWEIKSDWLSHKHRPVSLELN